MTTPFAQARLYETRTFLPCWLREHNSIQALCYSRRLPADSLHASPLSLVLQKSPKDPNDTLLPSRPGTGSWCSSFPTDAQLLLLSRPRAKPST